MLIGNPVLLKISLINPYFGHIFSLNLESLVVRYCLSLKFKKTGLGHGSSCGAPA
jgi:hypothetical protein